MSMTAPCSLRPAAAVRQPHRVPPAPAYLRRRLLVLGLVLASVVLVARAGTSVAVAFGGGPASAAERLASNPVHVVQPGETLWSIARQLHPNGDIRPLVHALLQLNGGSATLEVGQRVRLPRS
jgi:Tfp pilus assembly protein FimV